MIEQMAKYFLRYLIIKFFVTFTAERNTIVTQVIIVLHSPNLPYWV